MCRRRGRPGAGEAPEEERASGGGGEGQGGHGHGARQEVPEEDPRHQAELACWLRQGLKI